MAQAHWPTRYARLDDILSSQEILLDGCDSLLIKRETPRLAALLLARQGAAPATTAPITVAPAGVHRIAVDSLTLSRYEP